jgi:hypothetical protein
MPNQRSRPRALGSNTEAGFAASAEKDVSLRETLAAARPARLAQIAELKVLRIARDAKKRTADHAHPKV